jgi:hypothetical protein
MKTPSWSSQRSKDCHVWRCSMLRIWTKPSKQRPEQSEHSWQTPELLHKKSMVWQIFVPTSWQSGLGSRLWVKTEYPCSSHQKNIKKTGIYGWYGYSGYGISTVLIHPNLWVFVGLLDIYLPPKYMEKFLEKWSIVKSYQNNHELLFYLVFWVALPFY